MQSVNMYKLCIASLSTISLVDYDCPFAENLKFYHRKAVFTCTFTLTYFKASFFVSLSCHADLLIGIYLNSVGISYIISNGVVTSLAIMMRFGVNHEVSGNDDLDVIIIIFMPSLYKVTRGLLAKLLTVQQYP